MGIFLSKEEQLRTVQVLTIGLWFTSDFSVLTSLYSSGYEEFYLFNKIKIFKIKI